MPYPEIDLPNFCGDCPAGILIREEYDSLHTSPELLPLRRSRSYSEAIAMRQRGAAKIGEIAVSIGCQQLQQEKAVLPDRPLSEAHLLELMKNCPAYLEYFNSHSGINQRFED